jgi:hypothetical protein
MKKELKLDLPLYTILQVLSLSLFEKIPVMEAFSENYTLVESDENCKQMKLFD